MDIFNFLTMIGGLCLFLFGMNLIGKRWSAAQAESSVSCLEK